MYLFLLRTRMWEFLDPAIVDFLVVYFSCLLLLICLLYFVIYCLFTSLNFSCLWIFDIFVCLFIWLFLFCLFLFICLLPVSGWLKDGDDELIRRVSLRIEDVTGLTMDTAEELQVFTVLPRDQAGKIFTLLKKGYQFVCWLVSNWSLQTADGNF